MKGSTRIDFDVAPLATDPGGREFMAGHHTPARGEPRGVLQVLVHGNTYDHRYWDADPFGDRSYSYTSYMSDRGYDVLALDLPGTGNSTRLDGDESTLPRVAATVAGAIQTMRETGNPDGRRVESVALVGHSLGAITSVYIQARWRVAEVLVATGTGYFPGGGVSSFGPGVKERSLSRPYAELPPDERAKAFYHAAGSDPRVIEYDNETLRTGMPRRLWLDCLDIRQDLDRCGVRDVDVPVLVQLGEHDQVLPARHVHEEVALWTGSSDVTPQALADVGHCFNLHLARAAGWASIEAFLGGRVGRG